MGRYMQTLELRTRQALAGNGLNKNSSRNKAEI